MTEAINKCNANETAACCCVDVGTIMDNTDCIATYSQLFDHRQQAETMLTTLSDKARAIESEPCDINARYSQQATGIRLDVDFTFACQAETLIFQLGLR